MMAAHTRSVQAAQQAQLEAEVIQLIEVRISTRAAQRIGYMIHAHSMALARRCGIPKVFFADAYDELAGRAVREGFVMTVVRTVHS